MFDTIINKTGASEDNAGHKGIYLYPQSSNLKSTYTSEHCLNFSFPSRKATYCSIQRLTVSQHLMDLVYQDPQ